MTYFLDNTFPPRLAKILRLMEVDACHLTEVAGFTRASLDVEWMPHVANEGWVVVSGDGRILKKPHERQLWQSLRLTIFVMYKGYTKLGLWPQVVFLLDCWEKIEAVAARARPGDANQVNVNKKIQFIEGCD